VGKVDDLRRLREERYVAMQRGDKTVRQRAADIDNDKGAPYQKPDLTSLCGHLSISKKSCTRPAGHSEKNHRYS
jgi:hypothetical protein